MFSMFAGLARQGDLGARGPLVAWICNFRENRARGGGSGTASRLMVMAMGKWMLITRDLVSRGLGQWPEESPLQADGKGAHGRPGGESFSGKCTVSNVTFCREREEG